MHFGSRKNFLRAWIIGIETEREKAKKKSSKMIFLHVQTFGNLNLNLIENLFIYVCALHTIFSYTSIIKTQFWHELNMSKI